METYIVISALGPDRCGLLSELSKTVAECGCSIRESRMAVLGSECSMALLLAGNWNAVAKVESQLPRLRETLGLAISARRSSVRAAGKDVMPYAVEVVSIDRPGVVNEVAEFFALRKINIEDLYTSVYVAPHTSARMFSLHMTVGIPNEHSLAGVRGEFMDFCDDLNLDAMLAPLK